MFWSIFALLYWYYPRECSLGLCLNYWVEVFYFMGWMDYDGWGVGVAFGCYMLLLCAVDLGWVVKKVVHSWQEKETSYPTVEVSCLEPFNTLSPPRTAMDEASHCLQLPTLCRAERFCCVVGVTLTYLFPDNKYDQIRLHRRSCHAEQILGGDWYVLPCLDLGLGACGQAVRGSGVAEEHLPKMYFLGTKV